MAYSYEENPVTFPWNGIDIKDRIEEKLQAFIDFIAFSSLILAITGGLGVYASCYIQGIHWIPALGVIMTLVSFSVYNLNRKTDELEDEINHKERFSFTKKYEKQLFHGALVSYAVALGISAFYGLTAFIVVCIPLISGILYSEPLLPASWRYRRLKEIPLVKNILVAGAWALTLSLLPVYVLSGTPGIGILITAVFFFSYVFMASVLPDIRDRDGDAVTGIITLPGLIGIQRTNLVLVLMTSVVGCIIFITGLQYLPSPVILLLIIGISYMLFCILSMERLIKTNIICDFFADGGFIFFGLITFLFIMAGW